jgi:hypothetical protein
VDGHLRLCYLGYMALDVHVLTADSEQPPHWPLCQFGLSAHSAIFFGGTLKVERYPLLQRMQDYYGDARYSGDDLRRLLVELAEVLPLFSGQPEVHGVLSRFCDVCREAASQDKVVCCLGD